MIAYKKISSFYCRVIIWIDYWNIIRALYIYCVGAIQIHKNSSTNRMKARTHQTATNQTCMKPGARACKYFAPPMPTVM